MMEGNLVFSFLKIQMERSMVKFGLLLLCLLPFSSCRTQLIESVVDESEYSILQKTKDFAVDELGYFYLISNVNELVRYTPDLVEQYAYSNERLGSVTSIDANNPLKLLLFYENYQTIIMLDNLLGEIGRYNLFDLGFNDITAVGISNDNNVWLYDPIDYKLKKIDNSGRLLAESITMYNEGLEYIRPEFLVEKGNKVFVYDEDHGFFLFDNLGQYLHAIPMKGIDAHQVVNENMIVFLKDGVIHNYDTLYKSEQSYKAISEYAKVNVEDVIITKKYIYLRDDKGVIRKAN